MKGSTGNQHMSKSVRKSKMVTKLKDKSTISQNLSIVIARFKIEKI